MAILQALLFGTIGLSWIWLYSLWRAFERNRRAALATGLPLVCLPVDTFSPLWQILGPFVIPLAAKLPRGLGEWTSHARQAWDVKYGSHASLGDAFVAVSPFGNVVHIADPGATDDIVSKRRDFAKPTHFYKVVEVYGKNVVTTEGSDYLRYRRILGPHFSERINNLVWSAALEQVSQFLSQLQRALAFTHGGSSSLGRLIEQPQAAMKTVTLNVITAAAFGIKLPFDERSKTSGDGNSPAGSDGPLGIALYARTVHSLMKNLLLVLAVPSGILRRVPLKSCREASTAFQEFPKLVDVLIRHARDEGEGTEKPENLLAGLAGVADSQQADRLNDKEILANLFVLALAGYETTANALAYTLVNLAVHDDAQAWFLGQLDEELRGLDIASNPEDWSYDCFSHFASVQCVVNEVLRLHPTVAGVPKWTMTSSAAFAYEGRMVSVAAGTAVVINTIAMHRNPEVWGPECETFRPSRWMTADGTRALITPPRCAFFAFSEGSRSCLGRKFAKVEMVAVLASIFSKYRIELHVERGQTLSEAKAAARKVLAQSAVLATLGMRSEVQLRLVERK